MVSFSQLPLKKDTIFWTVLLNSLIWKRYWTSLLDSLREHPKRTSDFFCDFWRYYWYCQLGFSSKIAGPQLGSDQLGTFIARAPSSQKNPAQLISTTYPEIGHPLWRFPYWSGLLNRLIRQPYWTTFSNHQFLLDNSFSATDYLVFPISTVQSVLALLLSSIRPP